MSALELDPKMQVAQRNLEIAYFNTGYYDTRIPELKERLRAASRRPRRALGARPHVRAARAAATTRPTSSARCCATIPSDVGALLQLGARREASRATSSTRRNASSARSRSIPNSSLLHFTSARCCTIAA